MILGSQKQSNRKILSRIFMKLWQKNLHERICKSDPRWSIGRTLTLWTALCPTFLAIIVCCPQQIHLGWLGEAWRHWQGRLEDRGRHWTPDWVQIEKGGRRQIHLHCWKRCWKDRGFHWPGRHHQVHLYLFAKNFLKLVKKVFCLCFNFADTCSYLSRILWYSQCQGFIN